MELKKAMVICYEDVETGAARSPRWMSKVEVAKLEGVTLSEDVLTGAILPLKQEIEIATFVGR